MQDTDILNALIELNIITTDKIRKYPLSEFHLRQLKKMYAVMNNIPYSIPTRGAECEVSGIATPYYTTDKGLEILYTFMQEHSASFIDNIFRLYGTFTEDRQKDLEHYSFLNNFRGTSCSGCKTKAGTKEQAEIDIIQGNARRTIRYATLREARQAIPRLIGLYGYDNVVLYRWRNRNKRKGDCWREKMKLVVNYDRSANVRHLMKKEGDPFI